MQFINEEIINHTIDLFEDPSVYEAIFEEISESQKDMMAFIDEENQSLLTKNELAILQYLAIVICKSVQQNHNLKVIPGKLLEEAEEINWSVFHDSENKTFSNVLDKCFENYPQEDLLALVEDSIQEDDNEDISQPGKEIIFVAGKSIIDVLHRIIS